MGSVILIRPRDDAASRQASDWGDSLRNTFAGIGHTIAANVDDTTPPDRVNILRALGKAADLVCYFGHGDEKSWLTNAGQTLDARNVTTLRKKTIVSVACKTACTLGPDAITAGAECWLGFTISVPVISPHKTADPIGDAIVDGLAVLSSKGTMQQARDKIFSLLDQVVTDYDTSGPYSGHPEAKLGYYAAMALRDHVVVQGNVNFQPLP